MSQENEEKLIPLPIAVLALIGVAALLCCGVVIAIIVIPSISTVLTNISFYDDDLVLLSEALSARSDPDDSIPSAVFGIGGTTNSSPDAPWVTIELSYTEKCTDTIEDPCEQLADEFAHIVLEQYARLNDINGNTFAKMT